MPNVETPIGVPVPASPAAYVRNVTITELQSDGTVRTVSMQVIRVVDENGNDVRFADQTDLLQQLLDEMRATRVGMQLLVDWLNPLSSTISPGVGPQTSAAVSMPPAVETNVEENELIEIAKDLRQDDAL